MDEPLTRDGDADELLILHSVLRKSVAKHHTSRLELLFRLQFPELDSATGIEEQLLQDIDIMSTLEEVVMEAVSEHPLFTEVRLRQGQLLARTQPVLSAVAEGSLDAGLFRSLINAMQRFDIAINHFDKGITASLTDVDELTGLLNRTAMDRDLKRELAQAKRSGKPLCLAMVDADHFKKKSTMTMATVLAIPFWKIWRIVSRRVFAHAIASIVMAGRSLWSHFPLHQAVYIRLKR